MQYSQQQEAFFSAVTGTKNNIVLQARAGCGKSTTIARLPALLPSSTFVFLTFGKKNKEDLESKISGFSNASARTFHSVGWGAMKKNNRKFNSFNKSNNYKVKSIAESLIDGEEQDRWVSAVCRAVSLAKCRGFGLTECPAITDQDAWFDMIEHFNILDDVDVDSQEFVDRCIQVLQINNGNLELIDFDDQIYMTLLYNYPLPKYDFVVVDEAQDTNNTRRIMAKRLMANNGRLIAVGDDHQAIMGFTGADNDALEQVIEDLEAEVLPLSVTFRCPKSVVEEAQNFVPDIEASPSNKEGDVYSVKFQDFLQEVSVGTAVLCRLNKHLVRLFFDLLRRGISAKIEGRDQINGLMWMVRRFGKNILLGESYIMLQDWFDLRCEELEEKRRFQAKEDLTDKVECISAIIEYVIANGGMTHKDLEAQLESMFGDNVDKTKVVTLCSVHKSKGLEWPKVFILGFDQFMPSKYAKMPWERQQELNLQYVAVTRAMNTLVFVTDVPSKIERKDP